MTSELGRAVVEPRRFLIEHDPFQTMLVRARIPRADGAPRAWVLVAVAWVPLCLGALLRVAFGHRPEAILFDLSVHVRLLVVIPIMLTAARLFEDRCRGAVEQLYRGNFTDPAAIDRIVDRAERLRDSRLAALAMAVLAVSIGQSTLWGILAPTGFFAGVAHPVSLSFAHIWYGTVALPIVQFLLLRWLWHWAIWSFVVMSISRLPLATIATHPDHAAGLGFLDGPIAGFVFFVAAMASTIAAAWGTQILQGRATMSTFISSFLAFVVVAIVIGCGPMLAFVGVMYRARHRDVSRYRHFALVYVRAFHHKWIEESCNEQILGHADIQSLHDLDGAYANLDRARLVPFGLRSLTGIWLAALIPMLPIAVSGVPIKDLLHHLGSSLLGGLVL